MKQVIPINAPSGIAPTICSHYHRAGWHDFDPTSNIPHLAILVIDQVALSGKETEMNKKFSGISINPLDRKMEFFESHQRGFDRISATASPTVAASSPNVAWFGPAESTETDEPRVMCVASARPERSWQGTVKNQDRIYDPLGISPALHCCEGGNLEPKIIEPRGCYDNQFVKEQVIGSMQVNAMRGSIDGVSPCLTEAMGMGGGQIPMIVQNGHGYNKGGVFEDVSPTVTSSAFQDNNQLVETRYRIRKLTPTECFRLMGVDDSYIEKIKSAKLTQNLKNGKVKERPMPKTQLYKMAGNSIVVDVLYHIFHQMFIAEPPAPKPRQLSLFD